MNETFSLDAPPILPSFVEGGAMLTTHFLAGLCLVLFARFGYFSCSHLHFCHCRLWPMRTIHVTRPQTSRLCHLSSFEEKAIGQGLAVFWVDFGYQLICCSLKKKLVFWARNYVAVEDKFLLPRCFHQVPFEFSFGRCLRVLNQKYVCQLHSKNYFANPVFIKYVHRIVFFNFFN